MIQSGSVIHVVVDTGVIITYGGPDLIQILTPASYGKMCGLCGNFNGSATDKTQNIDGSLASDDSTFTSSWVLPSSEANCSEGCGDFCSVCNSTVAVELVSDNFCGLLTAPAGLFSGCHTAVDPQPFFDNCVNDLCMSNGDAALYCSSLSAYTFACQQAGADVQPWRGENCCKY